MKKLFKNLIIGIFLILLTGCSKNTSEIPFNGADYEELVSKISSLNSETQKKLEAEIDTKEKIKLFKEDFLSDNHYKFLGVYNSPEFSEDFITSLEAGRKIVELANQDTETKAIVIRELKDVIFQKDSNYLDQKRGAAIYFLSQILDSEEKEALKKETIRNMPIKASKESLPPSYTEYYLNRI